MKINKDSWHCRFVTSFNHSETPKTLCSYFWTFVFAIGTCMALSLIAIVIVGFFTSPIWELFFPNVSDQAYTFPALCIEGGIGAVCLISYLKNKSSIVRVMVEYIKAVKNKVCPLIELE